MKLKSQMKPSAPHRGGGSSQANTSTSMHDWKGVRVPPGSPGANDAGTPSNARLPKVIGGPSDLADRLRGETIFFGGAGSVGGRLIDSLARMELGELRVCDGRNIKNESLRTHLAGPEDVGKSKAVMMAERAQWISPTTRVRYFDGPFEQLPASALAGVTAAFVSTDNQAAELAMTEACTRLGIPLFQASVFGAALVSQSRAVFGGRDGSGPCLACGYTETEWDSLNLGTQFSCEGSQGFAANTAPVPTAPPTMSPPHLCSLAADLAIGEWLRNLLELAGPTRESRSLLYTGYSGGIQATSLERNPQCPIDHTPWIVRESHVPLADLSPRTAARIAGSEELIPLEVSLRVDFHRFTSINCCGCDKHMRAGRFVADDETQSKCEWCGREVTPHPLHSHRDVPYGAFGECLDHTFAQLGVAAPASILVRSSRGATLVCPPTPAAASISMAVPNSTAASASNAAHETEVNSQ